MFRLRYDFSCTYESMQMISLLHHEERGILGLLKSRVLDLFDWGILLDHVGNFINLDII